MNVKEHYMPAPIAVFAFNRPDHLHHTLKALAANDLAAQSDLTIYCDGPRSEEEKKLTDAVRNLAANATGFQSKRVVAHDRNMGCGKALRAGILEMFDTHERVIIIEDDILVAPNALSWFNTCLERYSSESTVFTVAGWSHPEPWMQLPRQYPYDAYFVPRFQCWGWASWRDRMKRVDWDLNSYVEFKKTKYLQSAWATSGGGDLCAMLDAVVEQRINTWDVQVCYAQFKHACLSVIPKYSYVTNIGTTGEGTHNKKESINIHPTNGIDIKKALNEPRMPEFIFLDPVILKKFNRAIAKTITPNIFRYQMQRAVKALKYFLG